MGKYIIGSIIGAIIGYITNWLAIKMLFRPHKEMRVGKFKVPFTPGVIPKEKSRIAKSVGESIGQHLLTKETITKSLCSENMNEQVDSWVKNKVVELKNRGVTVEIELKDLLGEEYSKFIMNTNNNLSKLLLDYINEEEVKNTIVKYISHQIMLELGSKPGALCESELYKSIKSKFINAVVEYKGSENFHSEIQKILEENVAGLKHLDKNFEEVIPKEIIDNIKVYIYGKKYDIAMGIKKIMKEEKNRQKLRQIVGETISTKLSPMIAMFMNADSINEKVITGINEFLDEEKNHNDIALLINDIIDKLLKNSISTVFSELSREETLLGIKPLINLLTTTVIDEKFIINTVDKIEGKINNHISIESMLEEAGIDYKNVIEGFIKSRIVAMAESDSTKIKTAEIVSQMVNRSLQIEMKTIFAEDGNELSKSISKIVREQYNKFVENMSGDVIEVLNVPKIVEDKINEFDVAFAEEIILEIASKELRVITWLGALLGSIMGLLSPILGSL